jgi:hypothetical protein
VLGSNSAPSTWHLQIDGKRDELAMTGDTGDYAAMATPVTSARARSLYEADEIAPALADE